MGGDIQLDKFNQAVRSVVRTRVLRFVVRIVGRHCRFMTDTTEISLIAVIHFNLNSTLCSTSGTTPLGPPKSSPPPTFAASFLRQNTRFLLHLNITLGWLHSCSDSSISSKRTEWVMNSLRSGPVPTTPHGAWMDNWKSTRSGCGDYHFLIVIVADLNPCVLSRPSQRG